MTANAQDAEGPRCFCRDCLADLDFATRRCSACGSPRLLRHHALPALALAHIDCDAFYATVEKRDNPALADRPVIIGGGKRGVVSAACYIARTYGVRSAMPMFKALDLCPHATVIGPDIAKYVRVGREVRVERHLDDVIDPLLGDRADAGDDVLDGDAVGSDHFVRTGSRSDPHVIFRTDRGEDAGEKPIVGHDAADHSHGVRAGALATQAAPVTAENQADAGGEQSFEMALPGGMPSMRRVHPREDQNREVQGANGFAELRHGLVVADAEGAREDQVADEGPDEAEQHRDRPRLRAALHIAEHVVGDEGAADEACEQAEDESTDHDSVIPGAPG